MTPNTKSPLWCPDFTDKEEYRFINLISYKGDVFKEDLNILFKKKASLDRALERYKKAKVELYDYEHEHADALIVVREAIADIYLLIASYQDYRASSKT